MTATQPKPENLTENPPLTYEQIVAAALRLPVEQRQALQIRLNNAAPVAVPAEPHTHRAKLLEQAVSVLATDDPDKVSSDEVLRRLAAAQAAVDQLPRLTQPEANRLISAIFGLVQPHVLTVPEVAVAGKKLLRTFTAPGPPLNIPEEQRIENVAARLAQYNLSPDLARNYKEELAEELWERHQLTQS